MRGWDQSHIEKLKNRGMVRESINTFLEKKKSHKITKNIPPAEPKPLTEIKQILRYLDVPFETEYKFLKDRRFRFDIAIPDRMIAVEYEGVFSGKSRHTNVIGYSNDCIKYNLAVVAGWRVLRYTQVTYKNFVSEFNKLE